MRLVPWTKLTNLWRSCHRVLNQRRFEISPGVLVSLGVVVGYYRNFPWAAVYGCLDGIIDKSRLQISESRAGWQGFYCRLDGVSVPQWAAVHNMTVVHDWGDIRLFTPELEYITLLLKHYFFFFLWISSQRILVIKIGFTVHLGQMNISTVHIKPPFLQRKVLYLGSFQCFILAVLTSVFMTYKNSLKRCTKTDGIGYLL